MTANCFRTQFPIYKCSIDNKDRETFELTFVDVQYMNLLAGRR